MNSDTFLTHFSNISDPRIERCRKHEFLDVMFLAISAVIAGADGWEDIEMFGTSRLQWLRQYRPFVNGIPRHDTIARVMCRLRTEELEQAFQGWIKELIDVTDCDVIAIDGKTARRSFDTRQRKSPLHTVSAWCCEHQLVLGQQAVSEKSNEITAIPTLLDLLDIENCIITLDAMGCQKDIAQQIIRHKADYILALKGNHSGMQAELEAWWHKQRREGLTQDNADRYEEVDSGHGRIETRCCEQLIIDTQWLHKDYRWSGLKTVIQVTCTVEDKRTGEVAQETRWYISSLALDARKALHAVRSHWQVESMHWVLDITFREDDSGIRKGAAPLVFNILRKIAMNLYRNDTSRKASLKQKRKLAALDDEFRSVLLESAVKMR